MQGKCKDCSQGTYAIKQIKITKDERAQGEEMYHFFVLVLGAYYDILRTEAWTPSGVDGPGRPI